MRKEATWSFRTRTLHEDTKNLAALGKCKLDLVGVQYRGDKAGKALAEECMYMFPGKWESLYREKTFSYIKKSQPVLIVQ